MRIMVEVYGKTYEELAAALDHASAMLRLGSPSERVEWEDGSSVDYTVEPNREPERDE